MKYAFILGSNAFITTHGSISYSENGEKKEFLRIEQTIKNKSGVPGDALKVSVDVNDLNGNAVIINGDADNTARSFGGANDRVRVTNPDGTIIIDVHELSDDVVKGLSHHITSEIDTEGMVAVIRVYGHFMAGGYHINIDNEKLFIDGNSYAESVQVEHNGGILFTAEGVLM